MGIIDKKELEELANVLKELFTTRNQLAQLLTYKLQENLNNLVPESIGNDDAVFHLLTYWAQPRYKTTNLINAARQCRPDSPDLFRFAQRYDLGMDVSFNGELIKQRETEALLKGQNLMLSVGIWMKKFGESEPRVCRIISKEEGPIGTGFLVGPSVIMTNFHVIKNDKFVKSPESVVFEFGYKDTDNPSSLNEIKEYKLRDEDLRDEDWLLASSRVWPKGKDEPGRDEIDYALVQLKGTPGKEKLIPGLTLQPDQEGKFERGFFKLSPTPYDFKSNPGLIILQHPEGKPLRMALDTHGYKAMSQPNQTIVKYNNDTLPGSSGSPCFSVNWELVALHHTGWEGNYNAGTPIHLIVEDLKGKLCDQKMKEILGLNES